MKLVPLHLTPPLLRSSGQPLCCTQEADPDLHQSIWLSALTLTLKHMFLMVGKTRALGEPTCGENMHTERPSSTVDWIQDQLAARQHLHYVTVVEGCRTKAILAICSHVEWSLFDDLSTSHRVPPLTGCMSIQWHAEAVLSPSAGSVCPLEWHANTKAAD